MSRHWWLVFSVLFSLPAYPLAHSAQVTRASAPLSFEPNHGQAPPAVSYILREGPFQAQFGSRGVNLLLPAPNRGIDAVEIDFALANPDPSLAALSLLPGHSNYLLGSDSSHWVCNVPNYEQIRYTRLYPGIEVLFYGNGQALEHDFKIAPGADPSRVALQLRGAHNLTLSPSGDLEIGLSTGNLTLNKPVAYQESAGVRTPVAAAFVLDGNSTVRFRLGAYDHARSLVIDPVLNFSTWLDSLPSMPAAVAADAAGNTYVAGETFDLPFPTTSGAFQTSCSNCSTIVSYVTKLNASGTAAIFSTLLSGSGQSGANSIAVDPKGNVIVAGTTFSADFPVRNPLISTSGVPGYGGYVASLTPDGSALNDSTIFPSTTTIVVATDSNDNVYFAGSYVSAFPATAGALNNYVSGGFNVTVTKMTSLGALVYNAILGDAEGSPNTGPANDSQNPLGALAITVDSSGSAYIGGAAGSGWPTTTGSYDPSFPGTAWRSAIVAKLHPDGSKLDYSTFIGHGEAASLALDSKNDVWFAGLDDDGTWPVTANAYNKVALSQGNDVYAQLSPDASQLLYSSYTNSNLIEPPEEGAYYSRVAVSGVAVDQGNNVWLAGTTSDPVFPLVNPLVSFGQYGLLMEYDPTGTKIEFATYFGDQISGVSMDPSGKAHIAGVSDGDVYVNPGSLLTATQYDPNTAAQYSFAAVIDPTVSAPAVCTNLATVGQGLGDTLAYPVEQATTDLQLTNCGNASLSFHSLATSESAFVVGASDCSGSFAVGSSCSIHLAYTPVSGQDCNAALIVTSSASLPTLIPLTLGSNSPCPIVGASASVNPALLTFASQAVNSTSAPQTVTLSNPGTLPLLLSSISVSTPEFIESNTCGTSVPPLGSCAISVSFLPLADGARDASLLIADDADFSPLTVPLSGTGAGPAPIVTLSPLILAFPQIQNSVSPAQNVTLSNTGKGPLSIASIATEATPPNEGLLDQFGETNNCPALLAAGASCTIAVTFSTENGGEYAGSGNLVITDNAADSPESVILLGNEQGVSLTASPSSLSIASSGATATASIQIAALNGATGATTLGCTVTWQGTGVPNFYPSCVVTPSPATIGGSATLTISTEDGAFASLRGSPFRLGMVPAGVSFGILIGIGFLPRRRWRNWIPLALLFALIGGLSACGGGSGGSGGGGGGGGGGSVGATPGNYIVTVTSLTTVSNSANISVTVQ
jgi:hypothetical protein